jgi:CRISPR-associated protein Cas5h
MNLLVFDVWGEYAHYKKIYATTSAVSYAVPPKTTIYGYLGAILGLSKESNDYLNHFQEKVCLVGIQVVEPIAMQRININLRPVLGRIKTDGNRKPTTMEFVYKPKYRLYVHHQNEEFYQELKRRLTEKDTVYTPTLGLAGLLSNFCFVGELAAEKVEQPKDAVEITSVIPKTQLVGFSNDMLIQKHTEIIEQSMFAIEMDTERNVTERDDLIIERKGNKIPAFVNQYFHLSDQTNVCLF